MNTNIVRKTDRPTADFTGHTIYLGLDVHRRKWSVTVYVGGTFYKTYQQDSVGEHLLNFVSRNFPGGRYVACYEAGFCGFSVYRELRSLGIDCLVVNPNDVPQTGKGMLSKTDSSDSKRLGFALSRGMLKSIYIPGITIESDRKLLRYRQRIRRMLSGHRKSLKSTLMVLGIKIPQQHDRTYWSNGFTQWVRSLAITEPSMQSTLELILDDVEFLRQRLLLTNRKIRKLSAQDRYSKMFGILTSVPGIGLITAMTMLTEIGDIERFGSFAKFNSFIGVCPSEFSSGDKERKGKMTSRKHARLRELIIEAAWVAIRADPALTLRFEELTRTKTRKRAIVVIARKLLSRLYSIWLKEQLYEKGLIK